MPVGILVGSSESDILARLGADAVETAFPDVTERAYLDAMGEADVVALAARVDILFLVDFDLAAITGRRDATRLLAALADGKASLRAMGFRVPDSLADDAELDRFLSRCRRDGGTIGVADPSSWVAVDQRAGGGAAVLCGPAFLLGTPEDSPLTGPGITVLVPARGAHSQRMIASVVGRPRTLLLALDAGALAGCPAPGVGVLFTPGSPRYSALAMASAELVVSDRLEPLLLAAREGAPAVLVGGNDEERRWATELGIGVVEVVPATPPTPRDPSAPVLALRAAMEARCRGWRRNRPGGAARSPVKPAAGRLDVACVADGAYVPFLQGFAENLRRVHAGPIRLYVAALDETVATAAEALRPGLDIHVVREEQLVAPEDRARYRARSVPARAFTSKPLVLRHALRDARGPVLLSDLDVLYFRSPGPLLEAFGDKDALVFPQLSDRYDWLRHHGMINTGMMVVRPGAEALLDLWSALCLERCEKSGDHVYFVDQAFLDLAPLYFDRVGIYRGGDENLAGWNRRTLGYQLESGPNPVVRLGDGRLAGSFHAAGLDVAGVHELKLPWDQLVAFTRDPDGAGRSFPLWETVVAQQRAHWPRLEYCLRLFETLQGRLGIAVEPTPALVEALLSGPARGLLSLARRMHAIYRRLRGGSRPVPTVEAVDAWDWWVRLQRTALGASDRLPVRNRRRREAVAR